ncbi:TetR/AcrR family transcriptional regulator [Streptomyces sp. NPDC002851]
MARVSQEHLDARRRQILDGAARVFTRNGFHASSMQDVLREVGLSAGAVYRYFRGKDELIGAIATETFAVLRETFEEAARKDPPPPPYELLGQVLRSVLEGKAIVGLDGPYLPELIVQVWAEALRSDELAVPMRKGFADMRVAWCKVVEVYQEAGLVGGDVPADDVARTMMALAQGFIAQQALFGDVEAAHLERGLRALMSMEEPKIS